MPDRSASNFVPRLPSFRLAVAVRREAPGPPSGCSRFRSCGWHPEREWARFSHRPKEALRVVGIPATRGSLSLQPLYLDEVQDFPCCLLCLLVLLCPGVRRHGVPAIALRSSEYPAPTARPYHYCVNVLAITPAITAAASLKISLDMERPQVSMS